MKSNKKNVKSKEQDNSIYDGIDSLDQTKLKDKGVLSQIKTLLYVVIALLCLNIFISFWAVNNTTTSFFDESNSQTNAGNNYDTSMFKSLSGGDFLEKIKNKETFFLHTGRAGCGYSVNFLPILKQSINDYSYNVYHLDVTTVTSKIVTDIQNINADLKEYFGRTPIVYYFSNGTLKDMSIGSVSEADYYSFIEKNGAIKK